MTTPHDTSPGADSCNDPALAAVVAALTAAYDRTVDAIMTTRFGPEWATRADLPNEAYTAEIVFAQWLSNLLDHIDSAAASSRFSAS